MNRSLTAFAAAADAALVASAVCQTARIRRATSYLRRNRKTATSPATPTDRPPTVVVLVPMWREKGTVPSAVAHFTDLVAGRPWARVVFLANDDADSDQTQSTFSALKDALSASVAGNVEVRRVAETTKADKLQTAMRTSEVATANIVAVYDADSVPDGSTLDMVVERLRGRLARSVVLQQTSLHLGSESARRFGAVIGHSALRQTRWSLHFELGRLVPPRWRVWLPQPLRRFRYIVGHGVFFTQPAVKLAVPLHGFLVEDAYMSLAIKEGWTTRPTVVEALPGLDISELPPSLGGVLDQKARWYRGPRDAFGYYKAIARGPRVQRRRSKARLLVEAAKLRMHAVYWRWGPPVYLAFVPAVLVWQEEPVWLAAHVVAVVIHAWGVDVVTNRAMRRLELPDVLRRPLPQLSLLVWVLWGICALPGFTKFRARRTDGITPRRAERSWEQQPVRVEELV